MTQYPLEHLTNLLTTDREKLTRICAEVCYGFKFKLHWGSEEDEFSGEWIKPEGFAYNFYEFQPLANTEKGRSQAFELMFKFRIAFIPEKTGYYADGCNQIVRNEDPQAAIVIAAILTAQQENKDGNG